MQAICYNAIFESCKALTAISKSLKVQTLFYHPVHPSLSCHGLGHTRAANSPHLLGLLTQRTGGTTPDCDNITAARPRDTLLLPDLLTYPCPADDVQDGDEHGGPAAAAVLPHPLGDLTRRVAGTEERDHADGAVTEASRQAVLEVSAGHDSWGCGSRELKMVSFLMFWQ